MRGEHRFGTGIIQGTIPSGFPVFWVAVPGCSRNGYGTSPNFWVQKKFIKLRQSTQNTWLRPAEFFWKFFRYSLFDLFRNLGDVFLSHFWIQCVMWLTVPCTFRCFSRNWANFLLFLKVATVLREKFSQLWRLNWSFIFITKVLISSYFEEKVSLNTKQLMISTKGTKLGGYKFV